MSRLRRRTWLALLVLLVVLGLPAPGRACVLLVGESGAELSAEHIDLVLLREGRHTVVTLQVHYRGPRQDFSLVIPVPGVPRRAAVHTLAPGPLERLEEISAARLFERHEYDPCAPVVRVGW